MKKILVSILLVFMIVGCTASTPKVPADMSAYPNIGEEHNFLELDSVTALEHLTKRKEGIYLITNDVSTTSADVVDAVEATMKKLEKKAYYVNTLDEAFDVEAYQAFDESLDPFDQSYGSIPFIVIITKDELRTIRMEFDGSIIVGRPLSPSEKDLVQNTLEELILKLEP